MAEQKPLILEICQEIETVGDHSAPELKPVEEGLRVIGQLDQHHRKFYNLLQTYQEQLDDLSKKTVASRAPETEMLLTRSHGLRRKLDGAKEIFWVSVRYLFSEEAQDKIQEEIWENYQVAVRK